MNKLALVGFSMASILALAPFAADAGKGAKGMDADEENDVAYTGASCMGVVTSVKVTTFHKGSQGVIMFECDDGSTGEDGLAMCKTNDKLLIQLAIDLNTTSFPAELGYIETFEGPVCKYLAFDNPELTDPTNPTQPTEPTEPTDPSQPTEPTDPTQPTEPTDPTQPTEPAQPTQPE